MAFNRRRFLTSGGLTLGLGGALSATDANGSFLRAAAQPVADDERIFAETPYLASLGLPRSWESVRRGLHPFSPDRVAILPILHPPSEHCLKRHAERMQEVLRSRPPDVSEGFWTSDSFRLYVEVSQVLDMYYPGVSFENYLTALVAGEQFYGLMGTDRLKWLLSLQFRWANTPRLANPPVDWWLFLLREPFAIEGFEGVRPMHLAVGQVDTGPFLEHGLFRCETGFLCQEWLRSLADCEPDFTAHVAGLNRLDAARLLNGQIAAVLEKLMVEER